MPTSISINLVSLGDFPIVTEVLPDETEVLKEESKRQPRNKVARFYYRGFR